MNAKTICFAAAALATVTTLGSVLALFHSASSTAWLASDQAAAVAHCDAHRASAKRRDCVQAAIASRDAIRTAAR